MGGNSKQELGFPLGFTHYADSILTRRAALPSHCASFDLRATFLVRYQPSVCVFASETISARTVQ